MNAGREPAHLVKELVQNALDALSQDGGEILLDCEDDAASGTVRITCRDNGCGVSNLANIRTVFYTNKTATFADHIRQQYGELLGG
ncbi:MAG: ATP-binding protein [Tepidisphaeraceae bacterium]|jgi:DNA mismatch repair ATPase MutL